MVDIGFVGPSLTAEEADVCRVCGAVFVKTPVHWVDEYGVDYSYIHRACNCLQNIADLQRFLKEHDMEWPPRGIAKKVFLIDHKMPPRETE